MIYVCNFNAHSVAVFASRARGNASPLRTIRGPSTGLAQPIGLAVDAHLRLHVANRARGAGVTVYPPQADGDVEPLRRLATGTAFRALAVAVSPNGAVFVAGETDGVPGGCASILRFPIDASRCEASIAGPKTGLACPVALAIDAEGHLLVANGFGGPVSVFAIDACGDMRPLHSFTAAGGSTRALACGAGTLVVSGRACLCLYDGRVVAAATPAAIFGGTTHWPLRDAGGVAIDAGAALPTLCVSDFNACALHVVRTRGSAPALRVASLATIRGPATGLDGPTGVLIASSRPAARTPSVCLMSGA